MRKPLRGRRKVQQNKQQLETEAILAANAAFYNAFSTLDYNAMEDLWLPDNTSICLFPSSKPLKGFSAILKSWKHAVESMDGNNLRNWMAPDDIRFEYLGTNKATIVCDELIFVNTSHTIRGHVFQKTDIVNRFEARNMFKKVGNRWYMCYHEAFMPRENDDYLELSRSDSEDSRSTFLTMMTRNTFERKRDRGGFGRFLKWSCSAFNCT